MPDPDPLVSGTDPEPDPYQNVTDPEHRFVGQRLFCSNLLICAGFRIRSQIAARVLQSTFIGISGECTKKLHLRLQESYLFRLKNFIIIFRYYAGKLFK